jgi:hypothetical protein
VLEVCVEPNKADALAQEQRDNVLGQLEKYLNQHGIAGELDRSVAPEIDALKARPQIADAVRYHVSPVNVSQTPILMVVCVSKSACARMAEKETKKGGNIPVAKGRLLLLITPDSIDDELLNKLKTAMSRFDPA